MHGGVKVYRGAASAARSYVEADRSRVDDYYLAEGSGLARRFGASADGVTDLGEMDADAYEAWVAGRDPVTGSPRGRLRGDARGVRFVEITVNGPKTWSLAAALHPEVAAAYDAAQDRAAAQIIAWVAEHSTTRVGPRGSQVQVPLEEIEAASVRHYTSRAGDPHRHLHLQFNARVFAEGKWRGLHTVGFRDSIDALNGIGHAAVATDPEFRTALVSAGFTLEPKSGEIRELAPYLGRFSARAAQIGRNVDRYEAEWRTANPGQEPGPALRQSWDRRAWKEARPDKVVAIDGSELGQRWTDELRVSGYRDPERRLPLAIGPRCGALDRDEAVETVLTRLGARRSAWNAADVRGEVERWVASTGLVAEAGLRIELAEDLAARVVEVCTPLIPCAEVPEQVRCLSSINVLAVEADIVTRLARRSAVEARRRAVLTEDLDGPQTIAVQTLVGTGNLVVIEGAAGAGKTTTLRAAAETLDARGRRMVVVTPALKAAQVARREVGVPATSVAWLLHQHGFRWDEDGRWVRFEQTPDAPAALNSGDLLVVDEAGMLDQDSALALLTVADETGARLALIGDRHQLPAVGRGGVLDLAHRWVHHDAHVSLAVVHRFADPKYAALTLAMRAGAPVFGELWERGQIRIYVSEAERTHALAELAADEHAAGRSDHLMIADTREQTSALNGVIRDRLLGLGHLNDEAAIASRFGERISVGDRVATRLNDRHLGVANRDTWTIAGVTEGHVVLHGDRGEVRTVPLAYAVKHLELAYATTVYGAQGETTGTGHLVLGEHTGAASAYVGMTRGRHDNVVHVVATDVNDARQQWDEALTRDRADLGPAVAAQRAALDLERYGPTARGRPARPRPGPLVSGVARPRIEAPPYVRPQSSVPAIGI